MSVILSNCVRAAILATAALQLAACEDVTRRFHAFDDLQVSLSPSLRLSVSATGHWDSASVGDTLVRVNGSPYVISVRVHGANHGVSIESMRIEDPVTGTSVQVEQWQPPVFDPTDEATVIVDRSGTPISPSSKLIIGTLRVGEGDEARVYDFRGTLRYEYREDEVNGFLQRLRSI